MAIDGIPIADTFTDSLGRLMSLLCVAIEASRSCIEIMHRNKDVILGDESYTNRSDDAPRNIFSLFGFALKILKSVSPSSTRIIEQFQDDRNWPYAHSLHDSRLY